MNEPEYKEENKRLRAILVKVCEAIGNGSCCSENSSIQFLEEIPKEIELRIKHLKTGVGQK